MAITTRNAGAGYKKSVEDVLNGLVDDLTTVRTAMNAMVTVLNALTAMPTSGAGTSACGALSVTKE